MLHSPCMVQLVLKQVMERLHAVIGGCIVALYTTRSFRVQRGNSRHDGALLQVTTLCMIVVCFEAACHRRTCCTIRSYALPLTMCNFSCRTCCKFQTASNGMRASSALMTCQTGTWAPSSAHIRYLVMYLTHHCARVLAVVRCCQKQLMP